MARYALIQGGVVVNVIDHSGVSSPGPGWIPCDGASPGWVYDGSSFSAPPDRVYKLISTEAFWERFTSAEMVDYEVAMQHDPAASNSAKKDSAKLRIFRRDAGESGYRNMSKNRVREFVTGLEGTVIAAGRAAVILDTPISADEAYTAI